MIYTLTANPAIDYHMDLSKNGFYPGEINRSQQEEMFPGGKGLNVAVVLSRLGIRSTAWGFIAGKTGALLETLAQETGCHCDFITLPEGETRINVKLDCAQETAINGKGPMISDGAVQELLQRIDGLTPEDTMVLSGNLQAGKFSLCEAICEKSRDKGIRLVVDTESDDLRRTLAYHPFLIKPNEDELLGIYDSTDRSTASIVTLMMKCHEDGAENVLVTLGGEGAFFLSKEGDLYHVTVPGGCRIISTVGAGDSALAGFLAGIMRFSGSYEDVLRLSCAAGSATACRKWLCSEDDVKSMIDSIEVSRL